MVRSEEDLDLFFVVTGENFTDFVQSFPGTMTFVLSYSSLIQFYELPYDVRREKRLGVYHRLPQKVACHHLLLSLTEMEKIVWRITSLRKTGRV